MPLNSCRLFKKYPNKYFVETGTFKGVGLSYALKSNSFEYLSSIEIFKENYNFCCNKFKKEINSGVVKLFLGPSEKKLWEIIKNIDEPITFWLDAHYSGKTETYTTGKSDVNSPILREINIIAKHPIKNHTILIDDRRDFGTHNFDNVTEKEVIKVIKRINKHYIINYDTGHNGRDLFKSDVLVAKI